MEAPAGVEYGSVSEWRRDPAQPRLLCAVGVVRSKTGRISALAACKGAYGRVHKNCQRHSLQQHRILVTTLIMKATQLPAFGRGLRRFSGWVRRSFQSGSLLTRFRHHWKPAIQSPKKMPATELNSSAPKGNSLISFQEKNHIKSPQGMPKMKPKNRKFFQKGIKGMGGILNPRRHNPRNNGGA
ncbi:hypothetical protein BLA29_000039 [Euroglyphus maynei]|uniref:Uncharacterized protein n=1 Tax=Euroglyphus maynei TaxID=6958 RepID=A0A1Y3AQH1_EURMA|nr:hypothetical protein BLA29_000039 [Euroglyphus maynei]